MGTRIVGGAEEVETDEWVFAMLMVYGEKCGDEVPVCVVIIMISIWKPAQQRRPFSLRTVDSKP